MKHVTITDEVDHAYGAAIVALSDVQFHHVLQERVAAAQQQQQGAATTYLLDLLLGNSPLVIRS